MEPRKSLVVQASRKDLAQQCIIPYIEGHKLPEVHDVIERIACSVVHRELWHYELPRRLIVNNMRVEQSGEHVIQSSADRAKWSSDRQGLSLLLPWPLKGHPDITTAVGGPRRAFKVSNMHGCPSKLGAEVPIKLASHLKNVTFYRASSSLMFRQSRCLRPTAFGKLAKPPPQTISCNYQMRTLGSQCVINLS